jgi:transcriptional regulator with XRE-family HTH domain
MRSEETVRARFGKLVADAARRTGRYDIDSPRGGGKAALARETGMAESAVGRMLKGETLPDPKYYAPIARAVDLDVRDLLVEAEIIPRESLSTPFETEASEVRSRSITPSEAADALGITDPIAREMFFGTVERLKRTQPPTDDADERGGTAAQM